MMRSTHVALVLPMIWFPAVCGCSRKPTEPEPSPPRIVAIDVERAGHRLAQADLGLIASDQVLVFTCRLENASAPRFDWRATAGMFESAAAPAARWTAPHAGGPVKIMVTVWNENRSVSDSVELVVNQVPMSLVAPADGAVLDNGCAEHEDPITWDFSWSVVANATSYHLVILTPAGTSFWEQITTATSYHMSGSSAYFASGGTWAWKVRAMVAGAWTAWSAIRGFLIEPVDTDCAGQLAGPTLLHPRFCEILDNGCSGGSDAITWDFSWSALAGADQYQIRIEADGIAIDPVGLSATSYRFERAGSVINGTYLDGSWTVRAHVGSAWTDWSRSSKFGIEPAGTDCPGPSTAPELLLPEIGAVMDNGCHPLADTMRWEFSWAPVSGASRYHLHVIHSAACVAVVDADNLGSTSHAMVKAGSWTGSNSGWGWRVRALVAGTWSPWSTTRTFNVEPLNTDCPPLGAVATSQYEEGMLPGDGIASSSVARTQSPR